ncbi:MAG: phosphate ABC transporter substrate-binding protein PstS [Thermoleophilia bacterium]
MKRRSDKGRFTLAAALVTAIVSCLSILATPAFAATAITGAGSTFAQPLYQKWGRAYPSISLNYQGVGSGQGITDIESGLVNFGASDMPLTVSGSTGLTANHLVQFPTAVGGVVPIVNIPGVSAGKLKLSGAVLAEIYVGKITTWNNKAITALNPGLKLPNTHITRVVRSDGSGTTFIFSSYLKAVYSSFPTPGKTVSWPGVTVGGLHTPGVIAIVNRIKGAIGYSEYSYITPDHLTWVAVRNRSGAYPKPNEGNFAAAAKSAKWSSANGFYTLLVNQSGTNTWPIVGATYALVQKSQKSYSTAHALLNFFNWGYKNATAIASAKALDYVPIPASVYTAVEKTWHAQITASGRACW